MLHRKAISPAHIAFAADNRLDVRNCYAAALSAGAYPSGAPSYRDRDCTIFNAAVEDLDGNVVEFVHKEPIDAEAAEEPMTTPAHSRVLDWQQSVASSGLQGDGESVDSRVSRAKSRAATVKDLVTSASRPVRSRSAAPAPLARAQTMPVEVNSDFPSKAFLGTLLGAAAGGALAWAMMKTENENARDEAAYVERRFEKMSSRRGSLDETRSHRNYSTTESAAPRSHRNFSTTESAYSRKYPPRSLAMARRVIDQTPYYNNAEVDEAISRFTTARVGRPLRRKTIDEIEYAPLSHAGRESRHTAKRSATMPPIEGVAGYLEAPKRTTSRHTSCSRRSQLPPLNIAAEEDNIWARSTASQRTETPKRSKMPSEVDDDNGAPYAKSSTSRHTSASRRSKMSSYKEEIEVEDQPPAPPRSILSRFSSTSRRSKMPPAQDEPEPIYEDKVSPPKSSHSRHSTMSRRSARQPSVTSIEEEQDLKRRDSGISMHSSRSHHSRHSRRSAAADGSQHSSASTLKPSRRGSAQHDSAAGVPLPGSRATSLASGMDSRARSYVTAADVPMPESHDGRGYDEIGEESDGLGDTRTVVPEDSISCVDFSKPRSSAGRSRRSSSKHSSRRVEAASDRAVRAAKKGSRRDSAATLPVRSKDDYYGGGSGTKRSTVSYA